MINSHKQRSQTKGHCVDCGEMYFHGDWIVRMGVGKFRHLDCPYVDTSYYQDGGRLEEETYYKFGNKGV